MSIYAKLLAIQSQLKAPKGQFNSFGHYKYRNCEDILEALKPICREHSAVLWLSDELVLIGDRYYIKATATLKDVSDDGEVKSTAYAREEETKKGMDGSQVTGASSSYARKYALNALFDIDDTKDSDTTNEGEEKELPPVKDKVDLSKTPTPIKSIDDFKCECCHKIIAPYTNDAGKVTGVNKLIAASKEKYGKILCVKCAQEQNNA